MAWHFPARAPFDLQLANGRVLVGCIFVCADEETFTVDYPIEEAFGRRERVRGQFRLDMLVHLAERAPLPPACAPTPAASAIRTGYVGP